MCGIPDNTCSIKGTIAPRKLKREREEIEHGDDKR